MILLFCLIALSICIIAGIRFNEGLPNEFAMPFKEGWDYIWVQYENKEDKGQKKVVKTAIAAYIIQVYEQTDFTEFGFIS